MFYFIRITRIHVRISCTPRCCFPRFVDVCAHIRDTFLHKNALPSCIFTVRERPLKRLPAVSEKGGGGKFSPSPRLRLSKNPGELERAAALSNFQSCPAACTVGTGRFLRRKISFSRAKIVSLQAPRPKNLRFLAETGEGGREAENPLGFQVSPLAKLPTAQIVDLRRGTWPGSLLPRPPACQNLF